MPPKRTGAINLDKERVANSRSETPEKEKQGGISPRRPKSPAAGAHVKSAEVWEVPHYCFVSSHANSPSLSKSAMFLTMKSHPEDEEHEGNPKKSGVSSDESEHLNIVSVQAKPNAPTADFEFHDILECGAGNSAPSGSSMTPSKFGSRTGTGVPKALPGSPSINGFAMECVQDILKGYHSSVLGFCQVTAASEGSATTAALTPTIDFLYGSNSGFFSTVSKYLFDSLDKGHGPETDVKESLLHGGGGGGSSSTMKRGSITSGNAKSPKATKPKEYSKDKWNYSVEVTFLEFFQEDFTDLLLLPVDDKYSTLMKKQSMRRIATANKARPPPPTGMHTTTIAHQDPNNSLPSTPRGNQSGSSTPKHLSSTGAPGKDGGGESASTPKNRSNTGEVKDGTLADEGQMVVLTDEGGGEGQQVEATNFGEMSGMLSEEDVAALHEDETPSDAGNAPPSTPHKATNSAKAQTAPALKLRKDPDMGPFVDGAQSIMVNSAQDLLSVVSGGIARRHDTKHKLNHFSHTIMKITVRQTLIGSDQCLTSVLTLADINTLERMTSTPGESKGKFGTAKANFQKARRAIASSMAFRRLIQQTHSPSATNPTNDIQMNSICRDSQLTQLLAESFVGNVKTRFVSAVEIPPIPEVDPLSPTEELVDSEGTAILQATLSSLRLLGRRPGHTQSSAIIRNQVKPNIIKVTVAAQTIQMEVQRLKRDLKRAEKAEDTEANAREKEELTLNLATQEGRLSGLTQTLQQKEESKEALRQRVTKQREALHKVTEELAKKEELLEEKEVLASQIDSYLADQKQAKQQLHQDRLDISMINRQISDANKQLAMEQSTCRKQHAKIQEEQEVTQEAKEIHAAAIFTKVLEKARVAEEKNTLTKKKKLFRGRRGVLMSKCTVAGSRIESTENDMKELDAKASAFLSRLDDIVADKTASSLENAIQSLAELVTLTSRNKDEVQTQLDNHVNPKVKEQEDLAEAFRTSEEFLKAQGLEEEFNKLSEERSHLSTDIVNLDHQIVGLGKEADDCECEVAALEKEEDRLREEAATTHDAITLLLKLCGELEDTIARADVHHERVLNEIEFLDGEIDNSEVTLETMDRFHEGLCSVAAEKLLPV